MNLVDTMYSFTADECLREAAGQFAMAESVGRDWVAGLHERGGWFALLRWAELVEAATCGVPGLDLGNLIADLEHRAKWWRQARIERVSVDNELGEDFARELDRATAMLRALGVSVVDGQT